MRDKLEIYLDIISETDEAFYVSDGDSRVWLPKSQVELDDDYGPGDSAVFTMPEWLALDKEFI